MSIVWLTVSMVISGVFAGVACLLKKKNNQKWRKHLKAARISAAFVPSFIVCKYALSIVIVLVSFAVPRFFGMQSVICETNEYSPVVESGDLVVFSPVEELSRYQLIGCEYEGSENPQIILCKVDSFNNASGTVNIESTTGKTKTISIEDVTGEVKPIVISRLLQIPKILNYATSQEKQNNALQAICFLVILRGVFFVFDKIDELIGVKKGIYLTNKVRRAKK